MDLQAERQKMAVLAKEVGDPNNSYYLKQYQTTHEFYSQVFEIRTDDDVVAFCKEYYLRDHLVFDYEDAKRLLIHDLKIGQLLEMSSNLYGVVLSHKLSGVRDNMNNVAANLREQGWDQVTSDQELTVQSLLKGKALSDAVANVDEHASILQTTLNQVTHLDVMGPLIASIKEQIAHLETI